MSSTRNRTGLVPLRFPFVSGFIIYKKTTSRYQRIFLICWGAICWTFIFGDIWSCYIAPHVASVSEAMEQVVSRSEEQHQKSMDAISSTMSMSKAVEVLQKSTLSTPALVQATDIALAGNAQLRKQPKGYAGLDSGWIGHPKSLNNWRLNELNCFLVFWQDHPLS